MNQHYYLRTSQGTHVGARVDPVDGPPGTVLLSPEHMEWQAFKIIPRGLDRIAFASYHYTYLSSKQDPIIQSPTLGVDEEFYLLKIGYDTYYIQTNTGKYLSSSTNNRYITLAENPSPTEVFTLIPCATSFPHEEILCALDTRNEVIQERAYTPLVHNIKRVIWRYTSDSLYTYKSTHVILDENYEQLCKLLKEGLIDLKIDHTEDAVTITLPYIPIDPIDERNRISRKIQTIIQKVNVLELRKRVTTAQFSDPYKSFGKINEVNSCGGAYLCKYYGLLKVESSCMPEKSIFENKTVQKKI
jgi:hypothetical protein